MPSLRRRVVPEFIVVGSVQNLNFSWIDGDEFLFTSCGIGLAKKRPIFSVDRLSGLAK